MGLLSNSVLEEPEKDENRLLSKEKLKKIELKPASFLEDEILYLKIGKEAASNPSKPIKNERYSPVINIHNNEPYDFLPKHVETYPKNPDSYDIKVVKSPDLFPLNLSQKKLTENLSWFTPIKNNEAFDNVSNFTVSSISNNIEAAKQLSHSKSNNHHLDKEVVNISNKKMRAPVFSTHKKNNSTFHFYFEEQSNQKSDQKKEKDSNNKYISHEKIRRSISVASPMKRDFKPNDDLREILPQAYSAIKLESDKELKDLVLKYSDYTEKNSDYYPKKNNNFFLKSDSPMIKQKRKIFSPL